MEQKVFTYCAVGTRTDGAIGAVSGAYIGDTLDAAKGFGTAQFLKSYPQGSLRSIEAWEQPHLTLRPGFAVQPEPSP